ncbi:hypothetical protein ACIOWK_32390 [Pseudomonas protegens]|uniref:hypothetical protein n=1 Tax=Pseudomonas protegens TaxID=380021 RepID=UPI003803F5F1
MMPSFINPTFDVIVLCEGLIADWVLAQRTCPEDCPLTSGGYPLEHTHAPTQFSLTISAQMPPVSHALALCPTHLLPGAVVALDDAMLKISDMDIREHMRARLSFDEMLAEMRAISHLAEQRQQYGSRAEMGLGGPRSYQDVGTAESVMDWMHEHELRRVNQIKLSLPSSGEEALAARERIQKRIAARRAARTPAAHSRNPRTGTER